MRIKQYIKLFNPEDATWHSQCNISQINWLHVMYHLDKEFGEGGLPLGN